MRIQSSQPVISWPVISGPVSQGDKVLIIFTKNGFQYPYLGRVTSGREIYLKKQFREVSHLKMGEEVQATFQRL